MKFAMISECAEGAGILYRLMLEGNDVQLYTKNRMYSNAWKGILPVVNDWRTVLRDDVYVLFDTVGFGNISELCRKRGIRTFGGSTFADKLEEDRKFGIDFMHKWGIKTPETKDFDDIGEAIEYAKTKEKLVFKPHGSHNDIPCSLTYVSKSVDDIVEYLEFIKKRFPQVEEFELQEFIPGVAISSEALVFDGKPTGFYDHTIENKKFMNDNIGPSTGCEGNVVWIEDDNVISEGIGKIKDFEGFTGLVDLNCIFNEKDIYGLEWTPRFGYDATPTLLCNLLEDDLGKFFSEGSKKFSADFATSIRYSIPPYPLEGTSPDYNNTGIPIRIDKFEDRSYYFYEVMIEDDILVHSSGIGNVGLGFGVSDDMDEAFEEALFNVKQVEVPDKQFRTDLGDVISEDYLKYLNWRR